MREALAANGDEAPPGSLDPEREPIPDVRALAQDVEARAAAGNPNVEGPAGERP
jgi:hypothetical protein